MQRVFLGAIALSLIIGVQAAACPPRWESQSAASAHSTERKITFDRSNDAADGTAARSLRYEFCIPAEATYREQVEAIDPSVTFHADSRGRIGCGRNQYLCLGETQGENWRAVVLALARLDFVERIDQSFGE